MASVPWRVGALLALLPLVFTGKAFLRGELYGPADLYYQHDPWKTVAAENGVRRIENPILSDLAFANLPWRAAVREAFVNGRLPLWNRFVLGGVPLLGTAQAAVFHPSTWLALFLPLALSWTFSCAFTLFLALLSGYLFFRELCRFDVAALVGAVGWGFSTYVVFWDGWAVGPSIAAFPLLLLGLRLLARGGERGIAITTAALVLSVFGGHPETMLHAVAAGGVYFLWELFARDARPRAGRAITGSFAAGLLAASLAAPVLLPLLEAVPHSAEYAARRAQLARGHAVQSVPADEAARRLLPSVLPFAHGIYGKSPVQDWRQDGSGMPLGYAGAVLFPLAGLGLFSRSRRRQSPYASSPEEERAERGRGIFLGFFLAGLAYGASVPLLLDATSRLPGFALALNYRLVFLAPFGLAGLAALGTDRLARGGSARLLTVSILVVALLTFAYVASSRVFDARELPRAFVERSILLEEVPLLLLIAAGWLLKNRGRELAVTAFALLTVQRALEMAGTYPTLPARSLAPVLPTLTQIPPTIEPHRVVAGGDVFRPNGAALYALEDVRGYESLVLARFAETYPLWCRPQFASYNRVDDLGRPFLSFLNATYAIAGPDVPAPNGWIAIARGPDAAIFENRAALPRAFVPRLVRVELDGRKRLLQMQEAKDFGETAWLDQAPHPLTLTLATEGRGSLRNGSASVRAREVGPDLVIDADAREPALVVTSIPNWPGWSAQAGGRDIPLDAVNHAFVGFWLPAGRHVVRLQYLPQSFCLGAALSGTVVVAALLLTILRRRRASFAA